MNWATTTEGHDPTTITRKHPDARTFCISLQIPGSEIADNDLDNITVRLHPGGLVVVLLGGGHRCSVGSPKDASLSSTRVVVFSWHHAKGLGVSAAGASLRLLLTLR